MGPACLAEHSVACVLPCAQWLHRIGQLKLTSAPAQWHHLVQACPEPGEGWAGSAMRASRRTAGRQWRGDARPVRPALPVLLQGGGQSSECGSSPGFSPKPTLRPSNVHLVALKSRLSSTY